ncbi:ATP synthase subunit I [Aquisalimonas lutea]|uniref:ATP synthase subunit I n=1 Tax=Aquisalimonas lutea TaxID=1327750 RepID=UPI0025B4CE61|nr:ATP synthase subunit I [Aquisalimonas lutea]MDN3516608.1 ATP synthase subunit I [Aquisalimonas lutea]
MRGNAIVRSVLGAQVLVTIASAAAWATGADTRAGLAAIAGGAIAIIPGLYMAVRVFSVPADAEPKRILGAFYRGESVKFALTAALFIIALQWFASTFLPLIVTYILALLVYWLALYRSAVTQR